MGMHHLACRIMQGTDVSTNKIKLHSLTAEAFKLCARTHYGSRSHMLSSTAKEQAPVVAFDSLMLLGQPARTNTEIVSCSQSWDMET